MITTKLTEITIIGHKKEKSLVIKQLHTLGAVHIAPASVKEKQFVQDEVQTDLDVVSKQLLELKYIIEQSSIEYKYDLTELPDYEELQSETKEFIGANLSKIKEQVAIKKDCQQKKEQKQAQQEVLEKIPFHINAVPTNQTHKLYFAQKSFFFPKIRKHIRFVLKKTKTVKGYYYLFTLADKNVDSLKKSLQITPLKKIDISFLENQGTEEKEKQLKKELEEIELINKKAEQQLNKIHTIEKIKIPYLITSLENYREEFMISTNFLASKNFFIIKGFCEQKTIPLLKKELPHITLITKKAGNNAPTKLREKGLNKHFKAITELFGLPGYEDIDPTPLVSFFYPFFFGFMLSDIGYGLALLLFIGILRFMMGKEMQSAYVIFGLSGISSIIFGLFFGSFFGNLIPVTPLIADAFNSAYGILKVSLIIGLVHLNLGAALNMYQMSYNKKGFKAIFHKATPFFFLELAALAIILGYRYVAIGFAILLLYVLIKEKGGFGIMDITGFFGTWFSYARLLALSLATAGVALAINIIAEKALALGKLGIILWLIVIIAGHLFNFALNILGCTIHAARLHYVEFFSLFFEGEGKKFEPFTLTKTFGGTQKWQK